MTEYVADRGGQSPYEIPFLTITLYAKKKTFQLSGIKPQIERHREKSGGKRSIRHAPFPLCIRLETERDS